jgi:hypothetical protein
MSTTPADSAGRTRRHRERRRQGTRCVTVDVNQSERDALVVRGYLSEEERDDGAAIKKANRSDDRARRDPREVGALAYRGRRCRLYPHHPIQRADHRRSEKGDQRSDQPARLRQDQGFVIDLRNNPGGLLDQAISVSDAFLDKGEIVSTRGRNAEETQRFNARPGDLTKGKPVFRLDGAAGRREVACRGQAQRAVAGTQRDDGLHRAFAERARADERRALVVLQRAGDDFRARSPTCRRTKRTTVH